MSVTDVAKRRHLAKVGASNAITALVSAGLCVMQAGEYADNPEAQELATALRDDIKNMIGDVEALQAVIR